MVAETGLKWSAASSVYKTIFIAGNEPFTQGTVDYHGACEAAAKLGIIVNTVHCGSPADGVSGQWDQGARIGGGKFLCINQDKAIIAVATPQDEQITKLSSELNKTYVPFGVAGVPAQQRQAQQDLAAAAPAAASAGAPVARAVAKSNALYSNANWDLVDAVNQKNVKLEDVKEADLPEPMRKMTPEQRKAYVEEQAKQRADLQKQINSLNADREKFIADKRKEAGKADTLDAAMLGAVDEQLKGKQFEEAK